MTKVSRNSPELNFVTSNFDTRLLVKATFRKLLIYFPESLVPLSFLHMHYDHRSKLSCDYVDMHSGYPGYGPIQGISKV